MSINQYIFMIALVIVLFGFHYFVKYRLKKYQEREQSFINQEIDVNVAVLSMKQTGMLLNNNPVVEMDLRVESPVNGEAWLLEKHKETIMLVTLADWKVGSIYQAKTDQNKSKIVFVRDSNDKPLLAK